ncbi:MAG: hypothetical protein KDJ65_38350 [Anaerolineae bacterium]|nr:hypothetical protein [Anaerolineae bacterium]
MTVILADYLKPLTHVIPFWKQFAYYNRETHKKCAVKFFFLWFISTIPLLTVALFHKVDPNSYLVVGFAEQIFHQFEGTHQFIYVVSFVAPLFYFAFEFLERLYNHLLAGQVRSDRKNKELLQQWPPGIWCTLAWALIVFGLSSYSFASQTVSDQHPTLRYIDAFTQQPYCVWLFYLFSVLCWWHAFKKLNQLL